MPVTNKSSLDFRPAEDVLRSMKPIREDMLIPLLQKLQEAYGYLPGPVLLEVSRRTGIPASRMFGVATFYEQFHLEPRGRHTVRCCRGTACHVKGGRHVALAIERILGIGEGQTTPDLRFTFETVACLGACFIAPAMIVDNDYYGRLTPERIKTILKGYS